jgi:hypothetical protein
VDGIFSFGRYERENDWVLAHPSFWYPEFELDLGSPGTTAHLVPNVWERFYSNGVVVCNGSGVPYDVNYDRNYRTVGGTPKKHFTVPASDSLIAVAA